MNATDLCEEEELSRLRASLDKQLETLQGAIARLANKLQRKLETPGKTGIIEGLKYDLFGGKEERQKEKEAICSS